MPALVTLTTDFGSRDAYVGAVKGVLLTTEPHLTLVDLSHEVPPQDVLAGAFLLRQAAFCFPPGSVHLAVVDPGVGSGRRSLVVAAAGYLWVGPDNGLFSHALDVDPQARAFELTHPDLRRATLSPTFHGRDLFAPAAARLAAGFPVAASGPAVADPVRLAAARPRRQGPGLQGTVVHVDRFGNLVSCITASDLAPLSGPGPVCVQVGQTVIQGLVTTYADVAPGVVAALVGSHGLLEIGCRDGSAAQVLGLCRGDPVHVESCP